MAWPPTLEALKIDLSIPEDDEREDVRLGQVLAAAIAYVEGVRTDLHFGSGTSPDKPEPTDDHYLGTLRLAGRWHNRRRSPDGMINSSELGATRVSSVDSDIEKMLGIGRYRGMVFA